MRIVKRAEFLALPPGTVFMKFKPCIFDDMCIKGRSLENDFYYFPLMYCVKAEGSSDLFDKLFKASSDSTVSLETDFFQRDRDGMFDDQLFAVFERRDVEGLIEILGHCNDDPEYYGFSA